jgi:hypothetical protein
MKSIILILALFAICQSIGIEFNINAGIAELLEWAGTTFNSKEVYTERQDTAEERFISYLGDGKITACYFHESKRHKVTVIACEDGFMCRRQSTYSTAVAGRWACAAITKASRDNKSYYSTDLSQ